MEFSYRVRGELSPYGRQRVYFSCHPDDFDLYFDELSRIIWKEYDCAIWYTQDAVVDEEAYAMGLREMQLMVVPITAKFLMEPNRARDFDFRYAIAQGIPVLPLMQTPGLDALFASVCGDFHYIDRNACNRTALTYEQKIYRFLSHILVNDDLLQRIRDAFYARIFLSYRKKDYAQAAQLMTLIHDIPACRDISIWYDEYLVPGEDFNDAILNALKRSRFFVLCVTENLVNEENYVQRIEYPEARKMSIPIIPIITGEMTDEQRKALAGMYADIPECIAMGDSEQISQRLSLNFAEMAMSDKANDPRHLFFVALAYLNGIEVEINPRRAEALLIEATGYDYPPAMEKLANMYRIGDGVARNPDKALEMFQKLRTVLENNGDDRKLYDALLDELSFLLDSNSLFRATHRECIIDDSMLIAKVAYRLELSLQEYFRMYSLLAFVNSFDDEVCDMFVELALKLLPSLCESETEALAEETLFYSRLAALYYEKHAGTIVYAVSRNPDHGKRRKEGESYIYKAIQGNEKLFAIDPVKWRLNYAQVLANFCKMNFSQQFASDALLIDYAERVLKLYQELFEDNEALYAQQLADFCLVCGDYLGIDLEDIWSEMYGIVLNLETEQYVPGMAEQRIPPDFEMPDQDELYDIRRIRKALALMRYGVALYEKCNEMGQKDCLADAMEAYHCLVRMLECLAAYLEDVEDEDIQKIRAELLKDGSRCCGRMLEIRAAALRALAEKHADVRFKRKPDSNQSEKANGEDESSEKKLLELEYLAYSRDPLVDCYNYAIRLSDNGFEAEAISLHTALRDHFAEFPGANPALTLMNLCECAAYKASADEALAVLLEFDEDLHREAIINRGESHRLFSYYCQVAECQMRKNDFAEGDRYFAKAAALGTLHLERDKAMLDCSWAICKKKLGDAAGAERLFLEGLDCLMPRARFYVSLWNRLCKEYALLLLEMGKADEAEEWMCEICEE